MADSSRLADYLQGRNPGSDPRFQDPENYVPSEVDYWRLQRDSARGDAKSSAMWALFNAAQVPMHFAQARWPQGRIPSNISKMFGWGTLGLTGSNSYDLNRNIIRMNEADQRMREWQQGGVPFTPEHMAESFRPRPPISGPNGTLETFRDPVTGEVKYAPEGATLEHDGQRWNRKMPGR